MKTQMHKGYTKGDARTTLIIFVTAIIAGLAIALFIGQARQYAQVREANSVMQTPVTLPLENTGPNTTDEVLGTSTASTSDETI